ncbi:uncharacterized protein KGF55_002446 [Candida pseudojiufengensis]|uniref:uncharacterized protein n=1 Tax=Candida pseudojiufengensis TaxID=497109 RepID=UPI002224DB53|nr:uncharacterized protein KGF55_002446 [Candida pseudojiufengensis]KAI5963566.1 hypothetical protein KGF55_002446 [Candida pseudojiufengensis]
MNFYFLVSLLIGEIYCNYIVILRENESFEHFMTYDTSYLIDLQIQQSVKSSFHIGTLKGFSGNFSNDRLKRLSKCPMVEEIIPDITVEAFDVHYQMFAPRHLARVSRRRRMLPIRIYPFIYDRDHSGMQVNAYVIDSGIDIGNPEFEGRAKFGQDFSNEGQGDFNGHGTHVAGLIGSATYGTSKNVDLIDVKALNSKGTASLSIIISALEFAVNHRLRSGKPGVTNLSFGAFQNDILNRAVEQASSTGMIFVVAAGNSNIDACLMSPASSSTAITVGAIDDFTDTISSFSNWGPCVDLFASGSNVRSVDFKNFYTSSILSGTSMSSPIVAGIVANFLSNGFEPDQIKDQLIRTATKDRISRASLYFKPETSNRIAYLEVEKKS